MLVIVNPVAGSGRARAVRRRIERSFRGAGADMVETAGAGEEENLARQAALSGIETIVAVGGDGTWGNVAHGIVTSGATPRLALLAGGTGNDFAKSINAPAHDPDETLRLIRSGAERLVDVGLGGDRVFLNDFGYGFDTAVLARSARLRGLRGGARYLAAAVLEIFSYAGNRVDIHPPPGALGGDTLLLVFANGRWFGGMFDIAPDADPTDGLLNVVRVGNVRGWRRIVLLAAAIRGRHIGNAMVETTTGASFTLRFDTPPLVNTDGDVRRASTSELVVRVLPRALRLVAPHSARTAAESRGPAPWRR